MAAPSATPISYAVPKDLTFNKKDNEELSLTIYANGNTEPEIYQVRNNSNQIAKTGNWSISKGIFTLSANYLRNLQKGEYSLKLYIQGNEPILIPLTITD